MNNRLEGLDFARALAVLGMMLVNYKLAFEVASSDPLYNLLAILEGRAAAVFLTLAGIGIGLMTTKGRLKENGSLRRQQRMTLAKRSVFLWAIGLILFQVFQWPADILHYYGAYMLLVLPLLYLKPKPLVLLSFAIVLAGSVLQWTWDYTQGWNFVTFDYQDFWSLQGFTRHLFFNGFHPILPWLAFILVGLALSYGQLSSVNIRRKIFFIALSTAVIIEVLSALTIQYVGMNSAYAPLFMTKPMPPTLFYMIAASAWAVSFIIICIELCALIPSAGTGHILKTSLIHSGQMALSHYVFHSAVVLTLAESMKILHPQSGTFVVGLTCGLYVFMIIFAHLWIQKFSRGPIELIMRRLTDGGQ